MFLIPTKRQWSQWSLPSQVSYIGFLLAILGLPLWFVSYYWPRSPDSISDQPQLSIKGTAKPYLRCSSPPGNGIEFSYELCIKNSGKNPAKNLRYLTAAQTLQIGRDRPITVDSRASLLAPARLVSGDYFCQIFTMRNPVEDPVQISKMIERYNSGEVSILFQLKLAYNDAATEKEYIIEERNLVKRDRIEIQ